MKLSYAEEQGVLFFDSLHISDVPEALLFHLIRDHSYFFSTDAVSSKLLPFIGHLIFQVILFFTRLKQTNIDMKCKAFILLISYFVVDCEMWFNNIGFLKNISVLTFSSQNVACYILTDDGYHRKSAGSSLIYQS